jgi:hypothetical protein
LASRSNALSELTRLWLQERHGCLVRESVPVRVPRGTSDIDLVAASPSGAPWGTPLIPPVVRALVETKDEHDYDPSGAEFSRLIATDAAAMGGGHYARKGASIKFSMLRQEHFEAGAEIFGTEDFARIFVVHNLNPAVCGAALEAMRAHRIYWVTARDLVNDLATWYPDCSNKPALRHSLAGDLLHLLVGYCGLRPTPRAG